MADSRRAGQREALASSAELRQMVQIRGWGEPAPLPPPPETRDCPWADGRSRGASQEDAQRGLFLSEAKLDQPGLQESQLTTQKQNKLSCLRSFPQVPDSHSVLSSPPWRSRDPLRVSF